MVGVTHETTNTFNEIQFMTNINLLHRSFGIGVPSSGSLSGQRNTRPTHITFM